jgi:hypothetical protein
MNPSATCSESGEVTVDVADNGSVGEEEPTSQRGLRRVQDIEQRRKASTTCVHDA